MTHSKFSSCLAISNPNSSRSDEAKKQVEQLATLFKSNFTAYDITKADLTNTDNLSAMLSQLSKNSLLVISGGDGTVSFIINLLLSTPSLTAHQATVLPLIAGNASDFAHMVHGKQLADVASLIETGRRVAVYPLVYNLSSNNKQQYCIAYISFGAIADTARKIDGIGRDHKIFSKSRLLALAAEIVVGWTGLLRAPLIAASIDDGKPVRYYDIVLIKGSRMAKLYHTQAQLTQPEYAKLEVRRKQPVLFTHLYALARHNVRTTLTKQSHKYTFTEAAHAQIDGEVQQLAPGTSVTVAVAETPYYVLSSFL